MITRQAFRANANSTVDGFLVKQLFGAGVLWLEYNQHKVNQLNVFPVPDGDTGTNMYLTMRSAYKEIANMEEAHVGKLTAAIARGALRGARGNSGVILSQILAGTAKALEGHDKLTVPLLAEACQSAVDAAYRAVEKPVEGTILTVARMMAESVITRAKTDNDLISVLRRMVFTGRAALRTTPELLPVLKKAGVVDSGGAGLIYVFEGMLRALCGRNVQMEAAAEAAVPVHVDTQAETWEDALVPEDELGYGYDVQFLMSGENMPIDKIRADIQAMGWSTLVVGDATLIKVHVHVHDPGQPISYAIGCGANLDDVVVENMQAQYEDYVTHRKDNENIIREDIPGVAVIAVAMGKGIQQLFSEELHAAYVITGGQTMNPSTGDFLEAIEALPNQDIILLPNNKNVFLAAQQAANHVTDRRVMVVPSSFIPQGIAAMFEYANSGGMEGDSAIEDVVEGMRAVLPYITTCEITHATRDVEMDGVSVRVGDIIGLINDVLVVSGQNIDDLAVELLNKASASTHERITIYYGSDIKEKQANAFQATVAQHFPNQTVDILYGGQALYPYIMSVE